MKIKLPTWMNVIIEAFKYRKLDMVLLYDISYNDDGDPVTVQAVFPYSKMTTTTFESLGYGMIDYAQESLEQELFLRDAKNLIYGKDDEEHGMDDEQ